MAPRVDANVTMRDGRRLAYTEWGTAAGLPVLFFHGTPGTRLWCPDEAATAAADVRLIMPDRPGVGRSDPRPRRTFGDWPSDVLELADALGLSRFAVVGVSAGGPYAAACAALIPSRLTDVAIVSSRIVALYDWQGRPGIEASWDAQDRSEFELTRRDPDAGAALVANTYREWASELEQHPEILHPSLELADGDRWFFDDPERAAAFDAGIRETLRQGIDVVAWEFNAAYLPWGFRLADIGVPVRVFHGSQDERVSQQDIDYQVGAIPRSTLTVWPDGGHIAFVKHWQDVLTALS